MSGSAPLVSVVTVSLNAAQHIEQSVQSVLSQDFDRFEHIVIDGGSTDATLQILARYADRLAHCRSEPDRGVYDAFNKGLGFARGAWVLFLNSDDYLARPDILSKLAGEAERTPECDVVFGQIVRVARETGQVTGAPIGGPFDWRKLRFMNAIPHPAALTSRRYFRRIGGFRDDFQIAGDYELFLRAGPDLRARFVPLVVTCMREGGLSRIRVKHSLAEWLRAVRINRALPWPVARVVYWYLLGRALAPDRLRSAVKRALGRR